MLLGYRQFKEIIVSEDKSDKPSKEYVFFASKNEILKYIEKHNEDPIICIYTTDIDVISYDLFNQGFDFVLTDNFKKYLAQGNCKRFVKFYHWRDKAGLICSSSKKFITKDGIIITNNLIKNWMISMFDLTQKG